MSLANIWQIWKGAPCGLMSSQHDALIFTAEGKMQWMSPEATPNPLKGHFTEVLAFLLFVIQMSFFKRRLVRTEGSVCVYLHIYKCFVYKRDGFLYDLLRCVELCQKCILIIYFFEKFKHLAGFDLDG